MSEEETHKSKKCWREDSCVDQEAAHSLSKPGYKGKYSLQETHLTATFSEDDIMAKSVWPPV